MKRIAVSLALLLLLSAFVIDKPLPDAAQEKRAQALFYELKCMVCQGQPIAESNAPLAYDMRQLIREKIAGGESDQAIRDYLEARYGAEIATTPPLDTRTLLLWAGPFVLMAAGLFLFWRLSRDR